MKFVLQASSAVFIFGCLATGSVTYYRPTVPMASPVRSDCPMQVLDRSVPQCGDGLTPEDVYRTLLSVLVGAEETFRRSNCDPRIIQLNRFHVTVANAMGALQARTRLVSQAHPIVEGMVNEFGQMAKLLVQKAGSCRVDWPALTRTVELGMQLILNRLTCSPMAPRTISVMPPVQPAPVVVVDRPAMRIVPAHYPQPWWWSQPPNVVVPQPQVVVAPPRPAAPSPPPAVVIRRPAPPAPGPPPKYYTSPPAPKMTPRPIIYASPPVPRVVVPAPIMRPVVVKPVPIPRGPMPTYYRAPNPPPLPRPVIVQAPRPVPVVIARPAPTPVRVIPRPAPIVIPRPAPVVVPVTKPMVVYQQGGNGYTYYRPNGGMNFGFGGQMMMVPGWQGSGSYGAGGSYDFDRSASLGWGGSGSLGARGSFNAGLNFGAGGGGSAKGSYSSGSGGFTTKPSFWDTVKNKAQNVQSDISSKVRDIRDMRFNAGGNLRFGAGGFSGCIGSECNDNVIKP